ncbi:hypothetical protein O6H91_19G063400 [Diphasiastrum complanatum]|uniref:Uncharacterized protein n=2 Tax=Diphasiastrum complanatum TaxID=34168 RepID=A0ACC2AX94_DIPCM|nr:hypothetical protein O6H91_19G063400 [Diphasiastrum complanatum]KAJ7521679.1 hypothetical protein O6H91_19G063400 [Diphasiastrum complanatum]
MDMFDAEKPIVFDVEEIIAATGNFKEAKKIGQGGYGSVYFGILRNQEVAIKQMKATKSREFFAELKVLCKVHHSNLVCYLISVDVACQNLSFKYKLILIFL